MVTLVSSLRDQWETLPLSAKFAVGGLGVGVSTVVVYCLSGRFKKSRQGVLKTDWKKDVVYLYQFPAASDVPSLSPYCLKLETWLRIYHVKYENIPCSIGTRSSEGMLPFVELNGKEYYDSGFIIDELSETFNKPDPIGSTAMGVARAFEQMVENATFWSYGYIRYIEKADELFSERILGFKIPFLFRLLMPLWRMRSSMKNKLKQHGIGRHKPEDIVKIGLNDLQAISYYLGNKQYLMGDNATRADAAVFGLLSQVVYLPIETPHRVFLEEKCTNLMDYTKRIRETFWPDWSELKKTRPVIW